MKLGPDGGVPGAVPTGLEHVVSRRVLHLPGPRARPGTVDQGGEDVNGFRLLVAYPVEEAAMERDAEIELAAGKDRIGSGFGFGNTHGAASDAMARVVALDIRGLTVSIVAPEEEAR
jgi:hypothetical protein